jgi:hypothetical protein
MLAAVLCVDAERKSLEDSATPLSLLRRPSAGVPDMA